MSGYSDREYWQRVRIERGWHAANDGTGPRRWFVTRETTHGYEYLEGKGGRLVHFGGYETAQRRADRLNEMEAK